MVIATDTTLMNVEALRATEEVFHQQIEGGLHPGSAIAAYRHGKLVLDLYGGMADAESGTPVAEDTMFVLYSCTKPLAAFGMFVLWERGQVNWDDPVGKYWPEFTKNGKAGVTVRHVMTHQAGFPATPAELTWDKWRDWDAVVQAMENATPIYEPGTVLAYHPMNFGWLVGELVRRIDGRPFNQFLQEELTNPLGMNDLYVGLPPSLEGRVSKIHAMEDVDASLRAPIANLPDLVAMWNRPEVHQAVIPAACGIATARDLARFYAMMVGGGSLDGVQILKPETIAEVTKLQVEGIDPTSGSYNRLCMGMALADPRAGLSRTVNTRTFGHSGAATSVGWADLDSGLAVAIVTNGFRADGTNNPRLAAFSQALRTACL
jgi:CubicO group peptidase (beta-lactamase class C family)